MSMIKKQTVNLTERQIRLAAQHFTLKAYDPSLPRTKSEQESTNSWDKHSGKIQASTMDRQQRLQKWKNKIRDGSPSFIRKIHEELSWLYQSK